MKDIDAICKTVFCNREVDREIYVTVLRKVIIVLALLTICNRGRWIKQFLLHCMQAYLTPVTTSFNFLILYMTYLSIVSNLKLIKKVTLADLQIGYYMESGVRSNVLPTSDLHVLEGDLSLIRCASRCREECSCQTYFYKSDDNWCSLYKYPLLENTPVSHNLGAQYMK